jgi:Mrp family chromosome partitioning ATPase
MATPSIISVFSARPDGATSVALGLAARLSASRRVLAVDLSLDRPEVAPLLNLDESAGLNQLASRSRLTAVTASELDAHVQWRDGIGVLVGTWRLPGQHEEVTGRFIEDLLTAATVGFDHIVIDLGRPRADLPPAIASGVLLWVATPTPLGLAALDRASSRLESTGCEWRRSAKVVLNRLTGRSWRGADRFIEREYGMEVVGRVPMASDFWESVEVTHSLRALCVPMPETARFLRAYGSGALLTRRALGQLGDVLVPASHTAGAAALEA